MRFLVSYFIIMLNQIRLALNQIRFMPSNEYYFTTQWDFSGVLMNRQLFYFSVVCFALSACSTVDKKRPEGNFDYAKKQQPKAFVVPENLDKPPVKQEYYIPNKINEQGPVGENMDVRAPSLVLPLAASSRIVPDSSDAIIWFDQVLENKNLLEFINEALVSQLKSDEVAINAIYISPESDKKQQGTTQVFESDWYHNEVETGWLFTDIESSTSMRFRYELFQKNHGRSVSLSVSLIDYMQTDQSGGSKIIGPIDKQRAEMAMLNEVIGQVDYNYRLQQRENRLLRANQKLVSQGENNSSQGAYIVEMGLSNLWDNMPIFFEKYGFTISDLNETNKTYYVNYVKPDVSIWDSMWGDVQPVVELIDAKYLFVLAAVSDSNKKTSVTLYDADGKPLSKEVLEKIFPVMEAGLSFRDVY